MMKGVWTTMVLMVFVMMGMWHCSGPDTNTEVSEASEAGADTRVRGDRKWPCVGPWCGQETTNSDRAAPETKSVPVQTLKIEITSPKPGARGDIGFVRGKASTTRHPIAEIRYAVLDRYQNLYWDGKDYTKVDPQWMRGFGINDFAVDLSALPKVNGRSYQIWVRVYDSLRGYQEATLGWFASLEWELQNDKGAWRFVDFQPGKSSYVLSTSGRVYRTPDMGGARYALAIGPMASMARWTKADKKIELAVGSFGKVWRRTEASPTWAVLKTPKVETLTAVALASDGKVGLVGGPKGLLWRSEDSGKTWVPLTTANKADVWRIRGGQGGRWWLLTAPAQGQSQIWTSSDGGKTWTAASLPTDTETLHGLWAVQEADGKTPMVIAVGEKGSVLRSTDEGKNWKVQTLTGAENLTLRGVWSAAFKQDWWAVGEQGTIARSTDQGETWTLVQTPDTKAPTLHDIRWDETRKKGLAVGENAAFWSSIEKGKPWKAFSYNRFRFSDTLRAVVFPERLALGYAAGAEGVLRTEDGGLTWNESSRDGSMHGLWFFDDDQGYAVGSKICKTTDKGKTWSCQDVPEQGELRNVFFLDFQNGMAVGKDGLFLKTTDGGKTWKKNITGTKETLHTLFFVDKNRGYIAGDKGVMLQTDNGGIGWFRLKPGVSGAIYDMFFERDGKSAFAVGAGGTILRTTDEGKTWKKIDSPTTQDLRQIKIPRNQSDGMIIGARGTILKTTDSGQKWEIIPSYLNRDLLGLTLPLTASKGFIVGEKALLLYTTDEIR